jgi:hypothetical protein
VWACQCGRAQLDGPCEAEFDESLTHVSVSLGRIWDGDSSTDVSMWNYASPRVLFDANKDGRVDGISPELGSAGGVPVAADWDGDGTDTLAPYRPKPDVSTFITRTRALSRQCRLPTLFA